MCVCCAVKVLRNSSEAVGTPPYPPHLCMFAGPEYQELQVPAMADPPQLQQPAPAAANRHPPAEQRDGAVVPDAFPDAVCVLFAH